MPEFTKAYKVASKIIHVCLEFAESIKRTLLFYRYQRGNNAELF